MGFSQRQAAGKFTRDEAASLIDRLREGASGEGDAPTVPMTRPAAEDRTLRRIPAEVLAAELERRGWIVIGP
jgi:hypothetical protein